jgi:hypothetical protein
MPLWVIRETSNKTWAADNPNLDQIENRVNVYILTSMMKSWDKKKWDRFKEEYPRLKQFVLLMNGNCMNAHCRIINIWD